ncbi:MAG: hypothetical protein ABTQ93_07840 [Candidatus Competibacter denitrificans]
MLADSNHDDFFPTKESKHLKTLPPDIGMFASLLSERVWRQVQVLLVMEVLQAMGLSGKWRFSTYHWVLSQARWSGLAQ